MPDDESAAETVKDGVARRPAARPDHARYRPIREIARGGMGRVFEAFDHRLSRTVALKEILDEHPEARARFEREVEITARLEHPSIVPLYDAGTSADGAPFYVMRRVAGEPLDTLISNASSLDQRLRLLPNVLALADAVAHAHARGVIHRDLKPSNVLVGELGETVVIDWGLAKLIGESDAPLAERPSNQSLTMAGTVFGTPGFMPPEQVAGERVDERADVYALGGCLYHVLAGRRPPETAIDFAIDGAPPELLAMVTKAMATDRTRRYLDAGGFSEDLRRFLGGRLVAAHHYPLHARIGRWLRRHRALVAVVTLALVVSIGGGVLALRRIFAEQTRAEDALAREIARTDDLLIYKATSYLDGDPTLAAATLVQLREDSPRWPTLGPLIAAIRRRGVAYGYPGPGSGPRSVELAPAPNDHRLLVAGGGNVRVIDLATRTTRRLVDDPEIRSARWLGANIAVFYGRRPPAVIDTSTGALAPAGWPEDARATAFAADGTVVYADAGGRGFAIRPNGQRVPIELPTDSELEVSPSARWIGATTATKAILLRATATGYERALELERPDPQIAFDGERHVAVATLREIVEYDLEVSPPAVRSRWAAPGPGIPRYIAGELHWWSPGRVSRLISELPPPIETAGGMPETATADRMARLIDDRRIELLDHVVSTLHPPESVDALLGKPGSPYLVAVGAARVFVWDLREVGPQMSTVSGVDSLVFGDPSSVIGLGGLDRVTLKQFRLTPALELVERSTDRFAADAKLTAYPTGVVAVFEPHTRRAHVLSPGDAPIEGIPDLRVVVAFDDGLIAGTDNGAIVRIDPATGRAREQLATVGFPIRALVARAGWIVAAAEDGRLVRRDPQGRSTPTTLPEWTTPKLAPDGELFIAQRSDLLAWPVGGRPAVVASFARELAIVLVADTYVVVRDVGGQLSRYDRTTRITTPIAGGIRTLSVSPTGVAAAIDNGLVVIDLASGDRSRLADGLEVAPTTIAIAPDGNTVIALTPRANERFDVHAWRLDGGTRSWLVQSTNAIAPPTASGTITYR